MSGALETLENKAEISRQAVRMLAFSRSFLCVVGKPKVQLKNCQTRSEAEILTSRRMFAVILYRCLLQDERHWDATMYWQLSCSQESILGKVGHCPPLLLLLIDCSIL